MRSARSVDGMRAQRPPRRSGQGRSRRRRWRAAPALTRAPPWTTPNNYSLSGYSGATAPPHQQAQTWKVLMSRLETPMTRRYWEQVGGTLLEEHPAVPPGRDFGRRVVDAVIIVGGDRRIASHTESIDSSAGMTSSLYRPRHVALVCTS